MHQPINHEDCQALIQATPPVGTYNSKRLFPFYPFTLDWLTCHFEGWAVYKASSPSRDPIDSNKPLFDPDYLKKWSET